MIGRAWLLGLLSIAVLCVLGARLAQLQLVRGQHYASMIADERLVTNFIPARRGRILDRHGTVIVDNRAVYHLAVVLADLEVERRAQRQLPFYSLDQAGFNALLADLSVRTMAEPAALQQVVLDELLRFPGTALRYARGSGGAELGVVALDRVSLLAALAEAGEDDSSLAGHLQAGLLSDEPASALRREFLQLRQQFVHLLTPASLQELVTVLGSRFAVPPELVRARLLPFLPEIQMQAEEAGLSHQWYLLTDDGRQRGQEALARLLSVSDEEVDSVIIDHLRRLPPEAAGERWLFVPAHAADSLGAVLPGGLVFAQLQLSGLPAQQQRIFILQGDPADAEGLFTFLCRRLAASIDFRPDELALLIRRHVEVISARQLEKRWRVHQLAFDPAILDGFCRRLASELSDRGRATTVLELEAALTRCRRRADRDWAGSTRHDPLILLEDLPGDIAIALAGSGFGAPTLPPGFAGDYRSTEARFPGLRINTDMGRSYPFDGYASHLIGWLRRLSSEMDRQTALAYGLDPSGWVGDRQGLEYAYDRELQGVVGKRQRFRVPGGYRLIEGAQRAPKAGQDLHTTLDMQLQTHAEDALRRWIDLAIELGTLPTSRVSLADLRAAQQVGQDRAGFVLMDCHSGAVLVSASTPGFQLSQIRETYQELLDPLRHPGQPLHDRATWPAMSPGSVVKPLVGMAAMLDGVFKPGATITTPGHMGTWRGGFILADHSPYGPHQGGHSWSMHEALQRSSNTFFSILGDRLGAERLADWYERFGLGRRNSVDLTWQRPGVVARPANIVQVRPGEAWQKSDTWRMAIGQLIVPATSPLQLVPIAAAVANGGTILRPYLAKRAASQAVAEHLKVSPAALQELRRGMEQVTDAGGTASKLRLDPPYAHIEVAAKTGTSEWGTRDRPKPDNAWLIGYAPAAAPEVAFAIFIQAAGTSGGRACSGVVKTVLQKYFTIRDASRGP